MFNDLFKNYIYPIAVFSGGMVGVGFLSLPYISMQVGIWLMLLYFLIITGIVVVINLIFCQISLETPDFKRFPGFVGNYLGKWAGAFSMLSTIFATIGILLVYLIVSGRFLQAALGPVMHWSTLAFVLVYFVVVSLIIYFDIQVIKRVEFWVIILLFLSLLFIFVASFSHIKLANIFLGDKAGLGNFFLPYGPMLFAMWGVGLIPEIEEMMKGKKSNLKNISTISTIVISTFYLLFVFLILGITGKQTDVTALGGLKNFLPSALVAISLLVGTLATFTAFITQGIIFKKTLMYDLKVKHWQAFVMTCCPPLILFLLGVESFIPLLSLIGGVLLGIDGIFILLIYKKIGGKKAVVYPLLLVFLVGVVYEFMYFIK